ncbi:hypothetical protein LSH36_1006g00024 [Paralvinella palmiformis]|uniref:non-specific serine/threonine protein kinase n=1 Tax=Paralvinella palmiformis TaxID=53620 RepID=A0AAD9IXR0_9ANNE|nr:hypothetical protein LSH36_1006g00024 [Paralvinella palmiformis]
MVLGSLYRLLSQSAKDVPNDIANRVQQLEEQIRKEEVANQELNEKIMFLQPELDRMGNEEALLQEKNMEFERKIALLGHELREAQRKSQYEAEMRQKAESANQDLKEKLQSEKDVIQKISSNSHQSNERISQLQKLFSETKAKLDKEIDTNNSLKSKKSDLERRVATIEKAYSELQYKFADVNSTKICLDKTCVELQSALDQEKNARSDTAERVRDLENRNQWLQQEVTGIKQRDAQYQEEAVGLRQKINELQKKNAKLELDLKTMSTKYNQEVHSHEETIAKRNTDKRTLLSSEESRSEELKTLKTSFDQEKELRQKAESKVLEMEIKKSELIVDLSQLRQQNNSLQSQLNAERKTSRDTQEKFEQECSHWKTLQAELLQKQQEVARYKGLEKQLSKDVEMLTGAKRNLEDELRKVKEELDVTEKKNEELQDQVETANYFFCDLYKANVKWLKEELAGKISQLEELEKEFKSLEEDKNVINSQLQYAIARADSEQIAKKIAEDNLSQIQKDKMMLEVELKEANTRTEQDLKKRDQVITKLEENNKKLLSECENSHKEKDDLNNRIKTLQMDLKNLEMSKSDVGSEIEQLKKTLEQERMKKEQAVNKLSEVMNRKGVKDGKQNRKVNASEFIKKDKECRKLQQELKQEREKFSKMVDKFSKDLSEAQLNMNEESQRASTLQRELDAKESVIEQLEQKLALVSSDTRSISSFGMADVNSDEGGTESRLEGWLAVPNKQNKRFGWKKQYVVVSKKKILFYESESSKQNADPTMVLDIDKIYHVRLITQNDAIRADAKDIPRIFQILYASEGENKKTSNRNDESTSLVDKLGAVEYKGHDFLSIHFRTPTSCEACNKPVWHMIHPPTALECRRKWSAACQYLFC